MKSSVGIHKTDPQIKDLLAKYKHQERLTKIKIVLRANVAFDVKDKRGTYFRSEIVLARERNLSICVGMHKNTCFRYCFLIC